MEIAAVLIWLRSNGHVTQVPSSHVPHTRGLRVHPVPGTIQSSARASYPENFPPQPHKVAAMTTSSLEVKGLRRHAAKSFVQDRTPGTVRGRI